MKRNIILLKVYPYVEKGKGYEPVAYVLERASFIFTQLKNRVYRRWDVPVSVSANRAGFAWRGIVIGKAQFRSKIQGLNSV